jgi:hypothetical protein
MIALTVMDIAGNNDRDGQREKSVKLQYVGNINYNRL